MKNFSYDVLVVGSGAAGLRAAIAAREKGVGVCVISKGTPGKMTSTILSGGAFAGAQAGSLQNVHLKRTLQAGRGINQPELVEKLTEEGPTRLRELREWGFRAEIQHGYLFSKGHPPIWGEAAAAWAKDMVGHDSHAILEKLDVTVSMYTSSKTGSHPKTKPSELKRTLQETLWRDGGILRNRQGLTQALDTIEAIQAEARGLNLGDKGREVQQILELQLACRTAAIILQAALRREESRGAHCREDFPDQNDEQWRGHLGVHVSPNGREVWNYQPM